MICIRTCEREDLPALVPLYRDFFNLHRDFLGNPKRLSEGEAREIAGESFERPQSWLIVAGDGETGEIIGFARWEEREGAFFGQEVFVQPAYRGQGIGARLMAEIEERVRAAGADCFFISVVPHNRQMLAYAFQRGYDTLNTVELRKELKGEQSRRDRVSLWGLDFKII